MHQIHFSVGAQPWVELAALPQTAGFLEKKKGREDGLRKGDLLHKARGIDARDSNDQLAGASIS